MKPSKATWVIGALYRKLPACAVASLLVALPNLFECAGRTVSKKERESVGAPTLKLEESIAVDCRSGVVSPLYLRYRLDSMLAEIQRNGDRLSATWYGAE